MTAMQNTLAQQQVGAPTQSGYCLAMSKFYECTRGVLAPGHLRRAAMPHTLYAVIGNGRCAMATVEEYRRRRRHTTVWMYGTVGALAQHMLACHYSSSYGGQRFPRLLPAAGVFHASVASCSRKRQFSATDRCRQQ